MKESVYGLEREVAQRNINQAVTAITLIILLAVAELVLTVFLTPILPAFSTVATQTINPLTTPTQGISQEFLTTIGIFTPQFTPTAQTTGCIPGQIMITSPKPGDVVKGQVTLMGTANIPNFGFYKYEFSILGTEAWSTIQASREVKLDDTLGDWNTSLVSPGDYNLRLVVVDNQGNSLPPCIVPLRVVAP